MHKPRLKERLLAHVPDLQAYKQGRDMYLAFDQDIRPAISKAINDDGDGDGMRLLLDHTCLICHTSLKEHLMKVVSNLLSQTRLYC